MYPPSDDMNAWNLGGQPPQGQYPGYPGGAPGYPAVQQGPYPGMQPGYPGTQPGYPGTQPGYPGTQPGYPGTQPGYPGMQPGYPGQQYNYAGGPQGGMTQPGYGVPGAPGGQQMGYAPGQSGVGPGPAYGQQFVQPSMGAGPTSQAQVKTNVLVSLVQAKREENTHVDVSAAQADAKALYDAGEKQLGTDESVFNRILVSKPEAHVRAVLEDVFPCGQERHRGIHLNRRCMVICFDLSWQSLAVFVFGANRKYFAKQLKENLCGR
ncbi:hypothetical protein AHF37_10153, partial [Paragonimus kellicotti]